MTGERAETPRNRHLRPRTQSACSTQKPEIKLPWRAYESVGAYVLEADAIACSSSTLPSVVQTHRGQLRGLFRLFARRSTPQKNAVRAALGSLRRFCSGAKRAAWNLQEIGCSWRGSFGESLDRL
eukprot:symbB.v1.2.008703.t1/scaffold543.1/size336731/16